MRKYRVGFVGTGMRSICYAKAYAKCPEITVTALADIDSCSRREMAMQAGLSQGFSEHDDWRELLHHELDGVIIASPNYLHREMAEAFIEKGIAVGLEKPLTTTMQDGEAILNAVNVANGRILVGFVLRSTPFYRKVYELLRSGVIGRIMAVEADELAGYSESSTMNRRIWRRYSRFSGGSLMEKSCHDMDLLNWLIDSRPTALNSFGGNLVFNPNPLLPETCGQCRQKSCAYRMFDVNGNLLTTQFAPDDLPCIYNIDKDVVDNQNINIQYENGTIATFLMSFNCAGPKSNRNLHAIGQKGRLWGSFNDNEILVYENGKDKLTRHPIATDGTGHGGGDENHALELLKMMKNPAYRPDQDAYAGYLGGALCIAADRSMMEARRIAFRYKADGYIAFS